MKAYPSSSMSSLKLWLVRHGESSINAGIWSTNPADARLTLLGQEQAQTAAASITETPDLIICSPFIRAKESANYIGQNWPTTPLSIWAIQELIYLSPTKMFPLSPAERKARIADYWQKADPCYCDGDDAESFANFLERVRQFHSQIIQQQGFVVVVGHGLFFQAFQLGLTHGFEPTSDWIRLFRQYETTQPIKNSEWLKIMRNRAGSLEVMSS
ncbi:MAG: phosphoglycerate mutase family protein [Legionella sp.]|uniref:histidine phosphatase family protein n=1 Tax=Legionella sp. TaxID=459 RepID=UPI00283AE01D|nr:phosphoglycerate mutase family protein [Legionella sp.]